MPQSPQNYPVEFSDAFAEWGRLFGVWAVSQDAVRETVRAPDQWQIVNLDAEAPNSLMYVLLKQIDSEWILILCQIKNERTQVHLALKVFPDLSEGFDEKSPLEVHSTRDRKYRPEP